MAACVAWCFPIGDTSAHPDILVSACDQVAEDGEGNPTPYNALWVASGLRSTPRRACGASVHSRHVRRGARGRVPRRSLGAAQRAPFRLRVVHCGVQGAAREPQPLPAPLGARGRERQGCETRRRARQARGGRRQRRPRQAPALELGQFLGRVGLGLRRERGLRGGSPPQEASRRCRTRVSEGEEEGSEEEKVQENSTLEG
mmetsp:Transcript_26347/g.85084  ORF Transcript_26347/g.85084 Transcript_26347/m.85084 type:complete len:201 (-) Transcript_26347:318-920(-)